MARYTVGDILATFKSVLLKNKIYLKAPFKKLKKLRKSIKKS